MLHLDAPLVALVTGLTGVAIGKTVDLVLNRRTTRASVTVSTQDQDLKNMLAFRQEVLTENASLRQENSNLRRELDDCRERRFQAIITGAP